MPRFANLIRATCFCSLAVLSACSTHKNHDEQQRMAAMHYYDDYYGQPPQRSQGHTGNSQQKKAAARTAAAGQGSKIRINPNAPKTYVVQKGDTLWGIARKFLLTPSFWPEIWDKNQDVANPHLIYPGDVLHFGYRKADRGEKLMPRIRIERKGQGEPLATLASFLAWPRVLEDHEIKHAPYILASRDDNLLMTKNDKVYVRQLRDARRGSRYGIFHPQKPLYDPKTKRLLGHLVDYVGYARVERPDKLSTVTILEAQNAIREGDRLFALENRAQQLRAPIQIPRQKIRGQIIALYEATYLGANCMIVVINQGKQQGIRPGYTLGVYAEGKVVTDEYRPKTGTVLRKYAQKTQLPPEKVAETIVYHVGQQLSYGLIVNSERELRNGDKIGNP